MISRISLALCFCPLIAAAADTTDVLSPTNYASRDIITRDVAVIGGGASGIYSALNLQWLGKSVVVVEKEAVLGGHTNTYTNPATNATFDFGVQAIWEIPASSDYLANLGISTKAYSRVASTTLYADFQTGEQVTVNSSFNFTAYAEQLAKYPYLDYSWNLPHPVPEDLLLPFAEYVTKYDIPEDLLYSIYLSGRGFANIMEQLTVNVFKLVDNSYLNAITGQAFVPASGGIGSIYTTALRLLGNDALLSSTVLASKRPSKKTGGSHLLAVQTATGKKLIKASKLLITIPPILNNMRPFDLDATETGLFSEWSYTNYFTMLINNTGLPSGFSYDNANASTSTHNIPELPAPYMIAETTIPGVFYTWYGSPFSITQAEVVADVIAVIGRLSNSTNNTFPPEIVEFRSHTPFKCVVSAEAIRDGFYARLKGLQGKRQTWYTGAAFISHDLGVLWNFTQSEVLPSLIA